VGRNTTTLFMLRLCGLADETTRPRVVASAKAEFFSILLEPLGDTYLSIMYFKNRVEMER
jgi:hypothetical protein